MASSKVTKLEEKVKDSRSGEMPKEAFNTISLNVSLCDAVADVLRGVDVASLNEHTVSNLMHLQQEKLDEIRGLLD